MSFSLPVSFADGDVIDGDTLRQNYRIARRSLSTFVLADFGNNSIDTVAIIKPEKTFWNNSIWVSGNFYANKTGMDATDLEYQTSHIKGGNYRSKSVYVDVESCGMNIVIDRPADVVVRIWGLVQGYANTVLLNSGNDWGDSSRFYLSVNGTIKTETLTYVSSIDGAVILGSPVKLGDGSPRWTPFNMLWSDNLSVGTHTIQLVCDPWLEKVELKNMSFILEANY